MRTEPYLHEEQFEGYTIRVYAENWRIERYAENWRIERKEKRQMPPSYGDISIFCHTCKSESFHPDDIANRYCARCHVFHEDEALRRRVAAEEASR